jgi:N utilization substance protein A
MNGELLRIVDSIHREKNIDAEIVFQGIELALLSAARKHFGAEDADLQIVIDRASGDIQATLNGRPLAPADLGRIAAQTAKQVMIQKIREAERASLMEDYADQIGAIISGQCTRIERGSAVVNLGRGEGFLPRSEQIPGETLHVADRIRAIILDVRESGPGVKIVLSRCHPDLIVRLFELEVPEVADRVITIEAIAREPGHRTKVAVSSIDSRVDAVGACVGIRGSRIKNIVEEVAGEKIDIVRYNESPQVFIANALKPAEVKEILLNRDINRAAVLVAEDQLSLAIGKKGQNVRLAARLAGWNIDIMTPTEYDQQRAATAEQLSGLPAAGEDIAVELVGAGYVSIADVADVAPEILARSTGIEVEQAEEIIEQTSALVTELEAKAAEQRAREEAEAAAAAEAGETLEGEEDAEEEAEEESPGTALPGEAEEAEGPGTGLGGEAEEAAEAAPLGPPPEGIEEVAEEAETPPAEISPAEAAKLPTPGSVPPGPVAAPEEAEAGAEESPPTALGEEPEEPPSPETPGTGKPEDE